MVRKLKADTLAVSRSEYAEWSAAIALARKTGDMRAIHALFARRTRLPEELEESFGSLFLDKWLRKQTGPEADIEKAKAIFSAVLLYRRFRKLPKHERLDPIRACERAEAESGIDYNTIWKAQNGDGATHVRRLLAEERAKSRTG